MLASRFFSQASRGLGLSNGFRLRVPAPNPAFIRCPPGAMLDVSVTEQYTLRARKYQDPQGEEKGLRGKHRDWMAESSSKARGITSSYY
jgi:hypothetical protein